MHIEYKAPGENVPPRIVEAADVSILYDKPTQRACVFLFLMDGREIELRGIVPESEIQAWDRNIDKGHLLKLPDNMSVQNIKSPSEMQEQLNNTDVRAFERSDFSFDK